MKRIGGIIQVKANGTIYSAKGQFTYNLGLPKRETVVGSDGVHGFKEMPQVPFIEGAFTDQGDLNMAALVTMKDATVTLDLANGKMIALRDAFYAGEGTGSTDEGEVDVRFEGEDAEEIV
jgi:hypothetical protein